MFMNKHITPPATFGVELADIFSTYDLTGEKTNIEKVFEISFENYKKCNPNATNEELNKFRSKGKRTIDSYVAHDDEVHHVVEVLKERITSDKSEIMEKYCKIFPLRVIKDARYYVSYVSEKYIKQYIGEQCPKFLYYYMFENQKKYEKEYGKVLLNLMEQGAIKSRWKNEFSLYVLIKSYFPSAIYQFHADWLEKQSLDIYIPECKIGIEYQGIQHYEAVDLFGGKEGLKTTQERDIIKKKKCKENKVRLVEWHYTKEINDWNFVKMLNDLNYKVPTKQYVGYQFVATVNEKEDKISEVICKYDLQGNLIEQYETVAAASMQSNVKEYMIRRSCLGTRNSAGGYQWRKMPRGCVEAKIPELKQGNSEGKPRKVVQMSEDGNIMEVYNSISEAVRLTGINSKSIRDAATGKQKHAGGFKWKYQD